MAIKNPSAIGQAINLAAADARQENKLNEINYIYKRYVFWEYFCDLIQNGDSNVIQEVINSKDFDEGMKLLRKSFEERKEALK